MADDTTTHTDDNESLIATSNSGAIVTERATVDEGDGELLTIKDTDVTQRKTQSASSAAITDKLRNSGEKLASRAGDKARGLVGQGLERTAEALTNVSKMVGDTADGIEERLGTEYGDYARRAAGAIGKTADAIGSKNPDELLDDTRTFVRNSPGIALAGAAVVGFVIARLLKSGIAANQADAD